MKIIAQKAAFLVFAFLGVWFFANFETEANSTNYLPTNAADGKRLYAQNCASCHGANGRSKTARGKLTKSTDLSDANWQADVSDERIYNVISRGKGKMPGYGKKLSDADINQLVDYVRTLRK